MSYAFVQSNAVTSNTGTTSVGLAFTTQNPTAGNLLVAMALIFTEPETVTASDTLTDTYTSLGAYQDSSFGASIAVLAAICKSSAADTITFSWGTSAGYSLFIAEFSGAAATVSEDGTMQTHDDSSNASSVLLPSFTPTAAGSLLLNVIGAGATISAIASAPIWTLGDSDTNDNGWLWIVAPSTAAVTPHAGLATAGPYASAVAGVLAPTGGGGGNVIPVRSPVVSQAVNRAATF